MEDRPVYSAEIVEIIGTPPRWLLRAGSGLLLATVLAIAGVLALVRVPEQTGAPVLLSSGTAPYYLARPATAAPQLLVASGQAVAGGQCLTRAAGLAGTPAPFSGTLYHAGPGPAAARPGDTLAVLVPLHNTYRFRGQAELGELDALRRAPRLQLQVPLDGQRRELLLLSGRLTYVSPVVRGSRVAYTGQLDSASCARLSCRAAAVVSLPATLRTSARREPLLRRLFR